MCGLFLLGKKGEIKKMIDLTPLAEAIIALATAAITMFLIPWLKTKYGNETLEKARSWVQIAVYAAEKFYGSGHGADKLEYVEQVLAQHKIKLDVGTLWTMVDAEIKKMEQAEGVTIELPPADLEEEAEEKPEGMVE